jgi:hypothetical protein
VLIFDAEKLAVQVKTEEPILNAIVKSYRHKVPMHNDTQPRFTEMYKKVFMATAITPSAGKEVPNQTNFDLPSHEIRVALLKGKETDRRQEFEQIINGFPKINQQKMLC